MCVSLWCVILKFFGDTLVAQMAYMAVLAVFFEEPPY